MADLTGMMQAAAGAAGGAGNLLLWRIANPPILLF
jgi:hypothetical protein